MTLGRRGVGGLFVFLAMLAWADLARANDGKRPLILMTGRGTNANSVLPLLDELCSRAAEGSLSDRYSAVLKTGQEVDLERGDEGMAPGRAQEVRENMVAIVNSAIKSEATEHCTTSATSLDGVGGQSFDALLITLTRDEGERTNLLIKLVTSDGTVNNATVRADFNAVGVQLASAGESRPLIGCLSWSVWSLKSWLVPAVHCNERWGLRAEPVTHTLPLWAKRSLIAGGSALLVAGGFAIASQVKFNGYVADCSKTHPCEPDVAHAARRTVKALDWTSGATAIVGAGLVVGGLVPVFLQRPSKERESVPGLTLGLTGGPGIMAVGRW